MRQNFGPAKFAAFYYAFRPTPHDAVQHAPAQRRPDKGTARGTDPGGSS